MRRVLVGLTVLLAATPSAFAELQIKDVRAMHGPLGPQRKSPDLVPGDDLFLGFTVTGAATDEKGNIDVTTTVDVFDSDGKQVLNQSGPTKGVLALGGDAYPGVSEINFGAATPPGEYKVRVTVHDRIKDASASFERKVTVKQPEFAFVKLRFSYDEKEAAPAPVGGVVMQKLYFTAHVLGFDRSQKKVKVTMTAQILDEKGKEMMPQPLKATVESEDEKQVEAATDLNFNANISLNRTGTYTLRLTFTDEIAKKTVTMETPMKVTGP